MFKKHINFNSEFMTGYVDNQPITFKVITTNSRSICFKIDSKTKEIVLRKGYYCSDDFVFKYISKCLPKYYKYSIDYNNQNVNAICNDYLTIFTNKYPIKIIKSNRKNYYELLNNTIYMHLTSDENRAKVIKKIYEDLAAPFIIKRTQYWAKKMNSLVKKIIFKNINYAFAYYRYSDNSITFSLRSACCSLDAFDYLIIHELSHYFYHNHQTEFWNKVAEFCPNYKELDKKLKQYQ